MTETWRWVVVGAVIGFWLGLRDTDRERRAQGKTWAEAFRGDRA